MTALLDSRTADRLAKLCGMFGSDHDGERASAAALADKLIREIGLSWHEVIVGTIKSTSSQFVEPTSMVEAIQIAADHRELLTDWERKFVASIYGKPNISPKQERVVWQIIDKVRQFSEGTP